MVTWCGGSFKALCLLRGAVHFWWKRRGLTLPALTFGNWLLMISASISGNSTLRDLFTKVKKQKLSSPPTTCRHTEDHVSDVNICKVG